MNRLLPALLLSAAIPGAALAQSSDPAVFVANNGNAEGSVTAYRINPDGSLTFRQKFITGTSPTPGTNAQSISLTPSGEFLAVAHATASTTVEQLTILRVAPDQTLSPFAIFSVTDSPLCTRWLRNDTLAVTRTSLAVGNTVNVYHFDAAATPPTLTPIDSEPSGSFSVWLAVHPSGQFLYAQTSAGANTIFPFRIEAGGQLTALTPLPTPCFPLGIGISPDGRFVYGGGGISAGSHAICGASIDATGNLAALPNAPFVSPGNSPKQVVVSGGPVSGGAPTFAFAAHGSDSSVRSFTIDPSGNLAPTGFSQSFGIQGSMGDIAVMGAMLFVCDRDTINDGVRGLRPYTIGADGSITPAGPIVDSQGVSPTALATWPGICTGDITGDRRVTFADLNILLANFGAAGAPGFLTGDVNQDGVINFADLNLLLSHFGEVC